MRSKKTRMLLLSLVVTALLLPVSAQARTDHKVEYAAIPLSAVAAAGLAVAAAFLGGKSAQPTWLSGRLAGTYSLTVDDTLLGHSLDIIYGHALTKNQLLGVENHIRLILIDNFRDYDFAAGPSLVFAFLNRYSGSRDAAVSDSGSLGLRLVIGAGFSSNSRFKGLGLEVPVGVRFDVVLKPRWALEAVLKSTLGFLKFDTTRAPLPGEQGWILKHDVQLGITLIWDYSEGKSNYGCLTMGYAFSLTRAHRLSPARISDVEYKVLLERNRYTHHISLGLRF